MIVVIQCAASKRPNAGHLFTVSGKRVDLVAHPEIAPHSSGREYARPDDRREDGTSWRQVLLKYNEKYNESPGDNPRGLLPAYQLYKHKAYERLVYRFGPRHVYVLSAGWGLIRADFLTPSYDITFSTDADHYKRRRKSDHYEDFHLPPDDCKEDLVFFGGKDYLPLFYSLTKASPGRKTVFFVSARAPRCDGYILRHFDTAARTNWHYQCAQAFLDGKISS